MNFKNKKQILTLLIITLGGIFTVFSSYWFFLSSQQEGILYEDIPFQRGVSFTTWGAESFNSTEAREEILEMKEIGIKWVGVNIWWTQKSITATKIKDGEWTDTPANITVLFDFIHSNAMKVFFKPMLDSEDGVWRSYIEASPEWIKEYHSFIEYTAEIAEDGEVEVFSLGYEMGNWQVHTEDIIELIKDVRKIYSGKLTYSANHDSFWYIDWWDKVDIIGVDAYFSFTLSYEPTLQDMVDVWNGFYEDLHKFQKKWNRPIMFAELGCQNRDGCNIAPNDNKFNHEQDDEEFQMFYKSLFESKIWTAPWFKGTYWWMWDLHEVDELDDNGFTPQLPIIKSILNKYYSGDRKVIYPSYWIEFFLIIVFGGLITFISVFLFKKFYIEKNDNEKREDVELERDIAETEYNPIGRFVIMSGLLLGLFLFWAFTYYNHLLFNLLYSAVTKSVFLGEGIILILSSILLTIISMVAVWIILQRLVYNKKKYRKELISTIALICSILIIILEIFFLDEFSNQFSIAFILTLQIMMLFGIIFSLFFIYGFPRNFFKNLDDQEKTKYIFTISLGILALSASMLIGLSLLLRESSRAPSMVIGIILIIIIPFIYSYFYNVNPDHDYLIDLQKKSFVDKLKPNQMKLIEALICIFTLGYYIGILRYIDNHTLINFSLALLPNFFIPIGFSLLIAIPMLLGFYVIARSRSSAIIENLDIDKRDKNEIMLYLLTATIFFSLIILIAGWWFSEVSYEIALILGGIPLAMIFMIFLIGNMDSKEIFKENSSWKRLTLYLIIILTVAFSASGAMVGLLYALTFLTLKDGQIVVRIAFEEELGFDVIQLIYNIQLLIAIVPIILSLILAKFLVPKVRK